MQETEHNARSEIEKTQKLKNITNKKKQQPQQQKQKQTECVSAIWVIDRKHTVAH